MQMQLTATTRHQPVMPIRRKRAPSALDVETTKNSIEFKVSTRRRVDEKVEGTNVSCTN